MASLVVIEIETAIRNISWATAQVGQKSLHTVQVDFGSKKVSQFYTTGKTHIGPISFDSARDSFKTINASFDSTSASFTVSGQTASGVRLMPDIDYQFDFLLSLSPRLVTVTGSHDGYPSYNIAVNGVSVYDYIQGHLGQLFGTKDVTVLRKSTPWKGS